RKRVKRCKGAWADPASGVSPDLSRRRPGPPAGRLMPIKILVRSGRASEDRVFAGTPFYSLTDVGRTALFGLSLCPDAGMASGCDRQQRQCGEFSGGVHGLSAKPGKLRSSIGGGPRPIPEPNGASRWVAVQKAAR